MKKLPTKINILGIPYRVKYCDTPEICSCDKEEPALGWLNFDTSVMRVFKGKRSREQIWKTIWHEILHAIFSETKLFKYVGKQEEKIIETISAALPTVKFD